MGEEAEKEEMKAKFIALLKQATSITNEIMTKMNTLEIMAGNVFNLQDFE